MQTPARTREEDALLASRRSFLLSPPRVPASTPDDDAFMRALKDDTDDIEESPWMSMGDLQAWSTSSFAYALRIYAQQTGRPWYVATMLPIVYPWPLSAHLHAFEPDVNDVKAAEGKKLAPDTMVAPQASKRARTSFDLVREGRFPPFVLEVVSPSSKKRDEEDKKRAYDLLGAEEYIVFTPREGQPSILAGWRRGESGRFEPWPADAKGALWSEVLGLFIIARGERVIARTVEGVLLLTPEEEADGRRQAEDEVARLRAEIERLRRGEDV